MRGVYADTSVFVSAYTEEVATAVAEEWLASLKVGQLKTSPWCETEIASALAAKTRAGTLAAADRQHLFGTIRQMLGDTASSIAVEHRHFTVAADFLGRSARPLRGGDALHLAIAADAGTTLYTLDRRMAEAGEALGLDVYLLR